MLLRSQKGLTLIDTLIIAVILGIFTIGMIVFDLDKIIVGILG